MLRVQLLEDHNAIQKMENHVFPLKSISATWLSPSSTSWVVDITLGLLCGLGLFLLLLPCLGGDPSSPQPGQKRNIRKPPVGKRGRPKSRKKSCVLKACRDCRRELEGARDLILLLQSNLERLPDKGDCHQLSYPDPLGEVCKPAPARAHQPHGEHVEDASLATSSTAASPAPLAEHPPPLASNLSPGPMTSPVCAASHSSLSASQLPEPLLPLECPSPKPWAFSLPTPQSPALVASPLPPPDSSLASPQCDSVARSPGTVPQSCSPRNNCWLSPPVSTTSGLGCSSDPVSALSWWQAAARAGRAWCLSTSPEGRSQQGNLSNHPPEALFWADATHKQIKAGGPSFINPDVQNLLEMLITKRVELKLWKGKKEGSSLKQITPYYSFWNVTDEPEQLPGPQQLSDPKPLGDHLQHKCSQCFWGHPFLHSESLVAAAWASGPPLEFPSVLFNVLSNSFMVQIQAKLPQLLPPQPWHQYVAPPQPLTETLPQPQPPPLAGIHTQAHFPPCLSTPPCYSPQITFCGVSSPTVHMKVQFPIPTAIQQLECHLLRKQQESRRALPMIVKESQEVFKQLIPSSWASQTQKSVSRHPGDVINPELQEQLEQHLKTSFTKHQGKLPSRNQLSLGMVQPQDKFPGAGQAKEKQGSSWPLDFVGGTSQDIRDMEFQGPAMWQLRKDSSLHLGHCLGSVQKDLSWDSENSPMTIAGPSSEEGLQRDLMSPSRSNTRNDFPGSPDKEHLEDVLKVHLSRKLGQIMENRIPVSVHHSRLAIDQALAPPENSNMHTETGNLASSEGQESCEDTLQELILHAGSQRVLEAHIKRLQVRRRWSLPIKIIKTKNLFMLKKAHPLLVPHSTFPSWATCESGDNSTAEVPSFPGEDPWEGPGEKVTTEKTVLNLTGPLPVPSPVGEDLQMELRGTQSGNNCGHTEAPSTVQEGRWPSQTLTCRTWHSEMVLGAGQGSPEPSPCPAMAKNELREEEESVASGDPCSNLALLELTVGSQSSGTKETTEPMEAKEEKSPAWEATLGASVKADSHTLNINMISGSPGNSKSSLPSTIYVTQDPEEECLNAQTVSECELAVEVEPQVPVPDVFLQDCTTGIILEDCAPDVLAADIWASQPSLSSSHSKSSGDIGGPHNLLSRGGSKILKLQDPWESPSKTFGPTDERQRCRRPRPGVHKQKSARPRTSQTNGMSHPSQDRQSAEFSQLLPKEGQAPTGSSFRNKMRQLLQRLFRKKGTAQEDPLQKRKPASATAQCWGPVIDSEMAEAQELTITIGQILEENMGLHHELLGSKGNWYKEEPQAPVGGSHSYHRGPSHLEQRRVKSGTACSNQDTPMGHSHPVESRLVRDKDSNWASPARACQHQPRVARASSHPVHCPRHSRLPRGVLPRQPDHTSSTFPGEKTFLPEKLQFRQRKPVLPHVSTSQIC